jgi:hypothetical protein
MRRPMRRFLPALTAVVLAGALGAVAAGCDDNTYHQLPIYDATTPDVFVPPQPDASGDAVSDALSDATSGEAGDAHDGATDAAGDAASDSAGDAADAESDAPDAG